MDNLNEETKALTAEGGSGDRCWEQGSEGTINGEPNAGTKRTRPDETSPR